MKMVCGGLQIAQQANLNYNAILNMTVLPVTKYLEGGGRRTSSSRLVLAINEYMQPCLK